MQSTDRFAANRGPKPYRRLREDPRYHELKKLVDEFPPEKMERLRMYIQQWSRNG
ncbi:MAG: hypothetical protein RDU20_14460 [Desulfomonilaceae bacterium]|nr:hypothetical protein [Desulfomonilaceae bacterium]